MVSRNYGPIDAVASSAAIRGGEIIREFEGSGRYLKDVVIDTQQYPVTVVLLIEGIYTSTQTKRWVNIFAVPQSDRYEEVSLNEAHLSAGDARRFGEALICVADEIEALEWQD
jgi:hypothetical protein